MSEFNEKASTPPDTATDAGRLGKVVAIATVPGYRIEWAAPDYGCQLTAGTHNLVLASDLDAVTAELNKRRAIEACDALADMPHDMLLTVAILQREELKADKAELERSRREVDGLREAVDHYDKALLAACPEGAQGAVHDHWNEARKIMAALSAGGSDGNA